MKLSSLPQYVPLTEAHTGCTACDLHGEPKTTGVPGVHAPRPHPTDPLPPGAPVLVVVGQNPGLQEDLQGLPFVGPTGQDLHRAYLGGIQAPELAHIYLTNSYRCYHATGNPRPTYVTRCLHHLQHDLTVVASRHPESRLHLLALGASATLAFGRLGGPATKLTAAFSQQGHPLSLDGASWTCFYTYHPAAVMRTRNLADAVAAHMGLLQQSLLGQAPEVSHPNLVEPFSPDPLPPQKRSP